MTAFTLTQDRNIDELTGKTGGDTYATAGFKLTIDQDSRYGQNQTTSTSLGSITLTAATGGEVHIDGTQIWLIPYTGGSGTHPGYNTVISNGTGSGKLIGVKATLTSAEITQGTSIPATGFIRVKQKTGTFQAGALTGITATASDAGRAGWLEIVGDEASTVNANRLGTFRVTGAWFSLGTTSGTAGQTMQVPYGTDIGNRYCPGVYIEKTAGQADYEFYPNAGTATTVGTEETRGKVVWIDNTGLVSIGHNFTSAMGYTPPSGRAVVVPNIFFENCTTASRTTNALPNATIATRYDFTTTGGGVLEIDKACMNWYLSVSQAYSVNISNSCFTDAVSLSEVATPMTFTNVGVGNKPTTALLASPLTMTYCFAGGTFTDCVWARVSMAASGAHVNVLTDISGFTFVRERTQCNTIKANATTYSHIATRVVNCTWTNPTVIQGPMYFLTCNGITVTDLVYANCVSGTTVTTYATYFYLLSNTINSTFSGATIPVTNTHPYTALLAASVACSNIKFRSIGTYASPLNVGSTNICGYLYTLATACSDIKVQRIYTSTMRTGLMSADNSCKNIVEQNLTGKTDTAAVCLNQTRMSIVRASGTYAAQTSVYGTHWIDQFPSVTSGELIIVMNEPTADTAPYVTLTGGAKFTSAGGLRIPTAGMTATWETPNWIIGHDAFRNVNTVLTGASQLNLNYSIDKNDGAGWSTMTTANYNPATFTAALNAITGISPSLGFKLRVKVTATGTNTNPLTQIIIYTWTSAVNQTYLHPLDPPRVLTLSGLQTNCDVVILQAGTSTELVNTDSNPTSTYQYSYQYAANQYVDIGVFKAGYVPFYIRNYLLTDSNATIPIAQVVDRNYS